MKRTTKEICKLMITESIIPKDIKTISGDCTTRALTYALLGEMTYTEVRDEQYRLSIKRHGTRSWWNYNSIYEKVLTTRGWKWVILSKPVTRDRVAAAFAEFDFKLLTHSCSHIAACRWGYVVDTWDSRKGRVTAILCPPDAIDTVARLCPARLNVQSRVGLHMSDYV